jgi:hypothetical protein
MFIAPIANAEQSTLAGSNIIHGPICLWTCNPSGIGLLGKSRYWNPLPFDLGAINGTINAKQAFGI